MNPNLEPIGDELLKLAQRYGVTVVDVKWKHVHGQQVLEVILDAPEGLTSEQAADYNRDLGDYLDTIDFYDGEYVIFVASPGIDTVGLTNQDYTEMMKGAYRDLDTAADRQNACGSIVEVNLYVKLNNRKRFVGELLAYTDVAQLNCDDEIIAIPINIISKMKLVEKGEEDE